MRDNHTPQFPADSPDTPSTDGCGDPVSADRARWLDQRQADWDRDHAGRPSPFATERLTGADVYYVVIRVLAEAAGDRAAAEARLKQATDNTLLKVSLDLSAVNLRGADLSGAQLAGAILRRAQLQDVGLGAAHLEGAFLAEAHLEQAFLVKAHLNNAFLRAAHLEAARLREADLSGAALQQAVLTDARLEGADLRHAVLRGAQLERADLREASLQDADAGDATLADAYLYEAHLERTILRAVHLEGADLRRASFDETSRLNDAHLSGAALDQASLSRSNLAVLDWSEVKRLGDEVSAREPRSSTVLYDLQGRRTQKLGPRKRADARLQEYRSAARAYRTLSVAVRGQGLASHATRFHFRSEVMERRAIFYEARGHLRRGRVLRALWGYVRWLLSLALGTFAGYGDYFTPLFLTYAGVVGSFAIAFLFAAHWPPSGAQIGTALQQLLALSGPRLQEVGAVLVLSVTSFHGRGLQPPGLYITSGMSILAGIEAVFGLLLEGLFIAAFTRRVTGN
jgi:uncharacterized protein YjbI with pentapeptide repeats